MKNLFKKNKKKTAEPKTLKPQIMYLVSYYAGNNNELYTQVMTKDAFLGLCEEWLYIDIVEAWEL